MFEWVVTACRSFDKPVQTDSARHKPIEGLAIYIYIYIYIVHTCLIPSVPLLRPLLNVMGLL